MRRFVAIMGILLTVTILISGSAVATWVYGRSIHSYSQCTNIDDILGPEDDDHATIGVGVPSEDTGWVIVDLDAGHGVDANTEFTVFAWGSGTPNNKSENYNVSIGMTTSALVYVGSDDDQENHTFTTPNYGSDWRYILIEGTSGETGLGDPIYGPEITAVGWDEP